MESSREFCCSLDDFGIRYNIDPQQFVLHTVLNSVLNFVKLYLVGYLLKSTSPKIRVPSYGLRFAMQGRKVRHMEMKDYKEMESHRQFNLSYLTSVCIWASSNRMRLNTKKCKEMLICFLRNKPDLPIYVLEIRPWDVYHHIISSWLDYPGLSQIEKTRDDCWQRF